MMNLDPKPDASLASLENLFWDYNYSLTGKDLYDFVLEKKEIPFLDRDQVMARMLMTVGWYRLIDIFGLNNLKLLLTDDVLKWVWVDDLREQYELARQTIERTDFIQPRQGTHIGEFKAAALFSRIDNPENILAEKLSYIHKKFPKDIADIWVICKHLSFHWEVVLAETTRKRTADPLFIAEILSQFPARELDNVSWTKPIRVEDFERDREIIIKNIITKEHNQLAGS